MYRDGVMVGTKVTGESDLMANANVQWEIGARGEALAHWDGWIDSYRATIGAARYASDSGYTVPTAAFPTHD